MRNKRTCCNCQYSRVIGKDNKIIDCINNEVDFNLLDKYKRNPILMPKICGHYKPKLIKKCKYCGHPINQPLWNWPYWVEDVFEDLPVCSYRCQRILQNKLDLRTENLSFDFNEDEHRNENYPF